MRRTLPPLLLLSSLAAGCPEPDGGDTGVDPHPDADIPILGTWTDEFGTTHEIDESRWTQAYLGYDPLVFELTTWEPAERWVVGRNGEDNAFDPGLWSRFDWLDAAGVGLYYCQVAFAAETEDDAAAAPAADADDVDGGCGGFPWTALTP